MYPVSFFPSCYSLESRDSFLLLFFDSSCFWSAVFLSSLSCSCLPCFILMLTSINGMTDQWTRPTCFSIELIPFLRVDSKTRAILLNSLEQSCKWHGLFKGSSLRGIICFPSSLKGYQRKRKHWAVDLRGRRRQEVFAGKVKEEVEFTHFSLLFYRIWTDLLWTTSSWKNTRKVGNTPSFSQAWSFLICLHPLYSILASSVILWVLLSFPDSS